MGTEEFLKMAKAQEDMCTQEVSQVLQKYSCSIHFNLQQVDGNVVDRGIFFKFRPEMMTNQNTQMLK